MSPIKDKNPLVEKGNDGRGPPGSNFIACRTWNSGNWTLLVYGDITVKYKLLKCNICWATKAGQEILQLQLAEHCPRPVSMIVRNVRFGTHFCALPFFLTHAKGYQRLFPLLARTLAVP